MGISAMTFALEPRQKGHGLFDGPIFDEDFSRVIVSCSAGYLALANGMWKDDVDDVEHGRVEVFFNKLIVECA